MGGPGGGLLGGSEVGSSADITCPTESSGKDRDAEEVAGVLNSHALTSVARPKSSNACVITPDIRLSAGASAWNSGPAASSCIGGDGAGEGIGGSVPLGPAPLDPPPLVGRPGKMRGPPGSQKT